METRTLVSASDPVWVNDEQTMIELKVTFAEMPGLPNVPFVASPHDIEPHGPDIFKRAVAGEFGEIGPYSPQPSVPIVADVSMMQVAPATPFIMPAEGLIQPRAQRK